MHFRRALSFLAWFLAVFFSISLSTFQAHAARIQGIIINADNMSRDTEKGLVELEGHIQVVYQGQHLKADKAKIWLAAKKIEASGNVSIVTPNSTIVGDRVVTSYETYNSVIYDGYVQSGQVIFEGQVINRLSENEYTAVGAEYTACTTCPAAWSFRGSNIKAELGGYAYIKNTFMKFGNVPVLWLPYLIVPLKSTRQTGLLTPEFEFSSDNGFTFAQPFFWAMSRNQDSTWTAKNYEKRGTKGLLNYRYVLTDSSKGEFDGAFLRDRAFGSNENLTPFRPDSEKGSPINRWFMKYNHYYEMPDNFIQRAQINMASDLQYQNDFQNESGVHGEPALENRVSLTKNTDDMHYSLESDYYYNLLQANPLANNDDAVHRLPELRVTSTEKKIGKSDFLYNFDVNYVNFARSGFGYDDVQVKNGVKQVANNCPTPPNSSYPTSSDFGSCRTYDGKFNDDTDLIRTGQRLDFQPSISRPTKLGPYVDIVPKISYRETQYSFGIGENPNVTRRYFRTELSTRTTMSRVFGVNADDGTRYKHEFQPEIIATTIPWIDQPDHSFFGTSKGSEVPFFTRETVSDADFNSNNGLQFDYNDRLYDRKLLTFALTNKLIQKRWEQNTAQYRQLAILKISQTYDAYQAERGGAHPWSDVATVLDVRFDNFQTYSVFNYYPYQKVTNYSARFRFNNDRGDFIQIAETKQYTITDSNDVDKTTRTEDYTLSGGRASKYLNIMGFVVYDGNTDNPKRVSNGLKSVGYVAQIKPPGDCWNIQISEEQPVGKSSPEVKVGFGFIFDGSKETGISSQMLKSYGM